MSRARFSVLAACLLALSSAGCLGYQSPFAPRWSVAPRAPLADSPAGAVQLLEWSWKNRASDRYSELFTDDFRFRFAEADSAGNVYRDVPFGRADELLSAAGLFVGTTDHAPASDIQLDFDNTLVALDDDRPGKHPTWHKSIRTRVDLRVTLDRGNGPEVNEVHGYANFYVVRGDSAAIPPELTARGFQPDPGRWWVERWEDETLPSGGARANPTQACTWGRIKVLYR